eukprot:1193987-Rhodomonas_salina.2
MPRSQGALCHSHCQPASARCFQRINTTRLRPPGPCDPPEVTVPTSSCEGPAGVTWCRVCSPRPHGVELTRRSRDAGGLGEEVTQWCQGLGKERTDSLRGRSGEEEAHSVHRKRKPEREEIGQGREGGGGGRDEAFPTSPSEYSCCPRDIS